MAELLTYKITGRSASAIAVTSALVIIACLTAYTSAQWLAGQKFLEGAFGLPEWAALSLFAFLIILYSSIGGFRGSVYTDTLQAFIRILGTVVALASVGIAAADDPIRFQQNISDSGASFMSVLPGGFAVTSSFVVGWAAAAIGFGLGQPQILSRYLSGASPQETRAARWIYLGFTQFTWISMTLFGILLRGIMPGLKDPESGLTAFFSQDISPVLTGMIVADVFATIAATSNGLLVAMSQSLVHDLLPRLFKRHTVWPLPIVTVLMGLVTMMISIALQRSVADIVLSAVSLMGAGLAPAVMIKVLGWRHTGASLLMSMVTGMAAAICWKYSPLGPLFNEAGIGLPQVFWHIG